MYFNMGVRVWSDEHTLFTVDASACKTASLLLITVKNKILLMNKWFKKKMKFIIFELHIHWCNLMSYNINHVFRSDQYIPGFLLWNDYFFWKNKNKETRNHIKRIYFWLESILIFLLKRHNYQTWWRNGRLLICSRIQSKTPVIKTHNECAWSNLSWHIQPLQMT